jgi:hypothetical protein
MIAVAQRAHDIAIPLASGCGCLQAGPCRRNRSLAAPRWIDGQQHRALQERRTSGDFRPGLPQAGRPEPGRLRHIRTWKLKFNQVLRIDP